jgi:uncharacterized protein YndB with AHSA1/START domain
MKPTTPVKVQVSHHFAASADRVFDAWLGPESVGQWLFATPTGEMVRVELDPRVGGSWIITERRDREDVEHTGKYLEIERPHRLVFTLRVPKYAQESDRVIVEIEPLASGCDLTLTHEMAPDNAPYAKQSEEGWTTVLRGLAATLGETGC